MAVNSVYPPANNTSQIASKMRYAQRIRLAQESSMDLDARLEQFERKYVESANRRLNDLRVGLEEIRSLRAAIKDHTQSLREAA